MGSLALNASREKVQGAMANRSLGTAEANALDFASIMAGQLSAATADPAGAALAAPDEGQDVQVLAEDAPIEDELNPAVTDPAGALVPTPAPEVVVSMAQPWRPDAVAVPDASASTAAAPAEPLRADGVSKALVSPDGQDTDLPWARSVPGKTVPSDQVPAVLAESGKTADPANVAPAVLIPGANLSVTQTARGSARTVLDPLAPTVGMRLDSGKPVVTALAEQSAQPQATTSVTEQGVSQDEPRRSLPTPQTGGSMVGQPSLTSPVTQEPKKSEGAVGIPAPVIPTAPSDPSASTIDPAVLSNMPHAWSALQTEVRSTGTIDSARAQTSTVPSATRAEALPTALPTGLPLAFQRVATQVQDTQTPKRPARSDDASTAAFSRMRASAESKAASSTVAPAVMRPELDDDGRGKTFTTVATSLPNSAQPMPVEVLVPPVSRREDAVGASTAGLEQVHVSGVFQPTVTQAVQNEASAPQRHLQASMTQPMGSAGFTDELVGMVNIWVKDQAQQGPMTAELRLNPESMGPVQIRIEMDGSVARVDFAASQQETRLAIEATLNDLSQSLESSGIRLAGSEVSTDLGGRGESSTAAFAGSMDNRGGDQSSPQQSPGWAEQQAGIRQLSDAPDREGPLGMTTQGLPQRNGRSGLDLYA